MSHRQTMKGVVSLIFLFGFLACLNCQQTCVEPVVHKRTIIRSAISIQNGATLLDKLTVESARHCYNACCKETSCNIAVMHYKQEYTDDGEEVMKKYCFLFDCKSPSVCSFDDHSRYAVIEVPKTKISIVSSARPSTVSTARLPAMPTSSTTKPFKKSTTSSPSSEEKCAPGVPVAMCADNPCNIKKCPGHENAVCKPSFCGGCFAKFYDQSGKKVQCTGKTVVAVKSKKNEETVVVASTDYEETPEDVLPDPAKLSHNPNPAGDQYFQKERRKWVDGTETGHLINATLPKTTQTTTDQNIEQRKVLVVNNSFMSIPLLIALCICILLILGLIYRFKCAPKGKPKKFPVDDGDYLINGMYL